MRLPYLFQLLVLKTRRESAQSHKDKTDRSCSMNEGGQELVVKSKSVVPTCGSFLARADCFQNAQASVYRADGFTRALGQPTRYQQNRIITLMGQAVTYLSVPLLTAAGGPKGCIFSS